MIVSPGTPICDGRGQLRGHGTYADEKTSMLVSSTLGSVERVAKWVAVKPAKHRYMPEVGDIVVGRVRDIAAKKWLVDIGARQDASLPLSAIHLSGGDQRRRTVEDQLAMRQILSEGDLISAEVHSVLSDGGIQLHARSMQYGKLENGTLVRVGAFLVPRQKQHVLSLPAPLGCDMVLGVNGWIFLTG
jgi:exosome complex component RRP4